MDPGGGYRMLAFPQHRNAGRACDLTASRRSAAAGIEPHGHEQNESAHGGLAKHDALNSSVRCATSRDNSQEPGHWAPQTRGPPRIGAGTDSTEDSVVREVPGRAFTAASGRRPATFA